MQKSRQIVKNKGDKGKQIRRFDRFVITRRLPFLNWETRRYKPKLGAEYYFSDIWDTCEHVHRSNAHNFHNVNISLGCLSNIIEIKLLRKIS